MSKKRGEEREKKDESVVENCECYRFDETW
jgi:hypothetical protein